ncbi:MAG: ATP-dependent Clp protease proteolytic subunit [Spirochaetota bacterium]|jgi:hypothetical protein|nr:ATP-dependent Clp protease proteolytic subunit [Spirochaetota bacterium]
METTDEGIGKSVYNQILSEVHQAPKARQELICGIEEELNMTVISFFVSCYPGAMIHDSDANMLQDLLLNTKINDNGLVLILNSNGGDGLAAERIVNICRAYSKNKFYVIVPGKAKSAATIICLGCSKIYMSPTAELGPIDPQVFAEDSGVMSVHSIVYSYDRLFKEARFAEGRLEPYLQQLEKYSNSQIEELRRALELSESIAIKLLKSGMMKELAEDTIKKKIELFLSPLNTKSHGRPIFLSDAVQCGINIEEMKIDSKLWKLVWSLFSRADYVLSSGTLKLMESRDANYRV